MEPSEDPLREERRAEHRLTRSSATGRSTPSIASPPASA